MAVEDHPRACGEQSAPAGPCGPLMGSPPRVRGTGRGLGAGQPVPGITPARAGNRESWFTGLSQRRDHPRACGEQWPWGITTAAGIGSPPRVRGTGFREESKNMVVGITPARAGNRHFPIPPIHCGEDHPRACGEQMWIFSSCRNPLGSPPRVRGTDNSNSIFFIHQRITPARAGNRFMFPSIPSPSQDHPRACGEQSAEISE